jgi:hypothetical protein
MGYPFWCPGGGHPAPLEERIAVHWNDSVLYDLLEPERQRQRNGLMAAIGHMLEAVYE